VIKLNLGCGDNKIEGFINIDKNEVCKPDLVFDFIQYKFPFEDNSVEEVVLFHCIEHIEEKFQESVLEEIHRVLKMDGTFLVSFPEFLKCSENYRVNYKGMREFWKATIYGRQSGPGDYHVTLMDSPFFVLKLECLGFRVANVCPESEEDNYNTLIECVKVAAWMSKEDLYREEIFS
jgi:SAM-dependent methyltransferase